MKHTLFFLALVTIVTIISCKKDKENTTTTTTPYGINSTDIGGVGDTFRLAIHPVNAGDNAYLLGSASSGQIWDYDSIPFSANIDTTIFLNPASNPDYSFFPTSNLLIPDGSQSSMFLNKSSQKVDLIGIKANMNGTIIKDTLGNPWTVLQFPMQLGSSYTDSGSVSIDTQFDFGSGLAPARVKMKYKLISTIDASGTVKTPTGTYECVRNKRIEYQAFNVYAIVLGQEVSAFSSKDTTYKYDYWSKSKKWNVIEIETNQSDVIKSIGYLLE
jgi:hypothetical protein